MEREPLLNETGQSCHTNSPLNVFVRESLTLVALAWPVIISYLLSFTLNIASVFSLGHIGTTELASIALATMLCNVTGFSVGMGMASALDTLCSQSYTGSTDRHALGKHVQRGIVVMFFLSIPIATLWLFTEQLLIIAGQDAAISKLAGVFTFWMIPGLFPYLVSDCLKRYLQAQGLMKPSMYITMICCPLNIFFQWLFVWSPINIGVIGAPIATSLINFIIAGMTICYIAWFEGGDCWGGWEWREALDFKQIWIMLGLGVPGILMLCSEWWAYEVVALAAGILGDKTLAAQTILINTTSLFYMNAIGAAIATSTRIGNCLGANESRNARNAAFSAMCLALILGGINCSLLMTVRNVWGYIFTSDVETVLIVSSVLPLVAAFQFVDCLGAVSGGILRGCGRQKLGAVLNFSAYYILGLPLSVTFTFKFGMGLVGLWLGLIVGQVIVATVALGIITNTNWVEQAKNAKELMDSQADLFADTQSLVSECTSET